MERKKGNEEIPRWVRNFITRREREIDQEGLGLWTSATDYLNDSYLLCPFDETEQRAVITGFAKMRDEACLRFVRKQGKLRRAGEFVPDSGISTRDAEITLASDLHIYEILHPPLPRKEVRRIVAKYLGLKRWRDKPWRDPSKFNEWMLSRTADDTKAVWAINESVEGRLFLSLAVVSILSKIDYSKLPIETLVNYIGTGAYNFVVFKGLTGCDTIEEYLQYYPDKPLPVRLVNEMAIKGRPFYSLGAYVAFVESIPRRQFALKELAPKINQDPELKAWLGVESVKYCGGWYERLLPRGSKVPSETEAWKSLEVATGKKLNNLKRHFRTIHQLESYLKKDDGTYDMLRQSEVEAQETLVNRFWEIHQNLTTGKQPLHNIIEDGFASKLFPLITLQGKHIESLCEDDPQFRASRKAYKRYQRIEKPQTEIERQNILINLKDYIKEVRQETARQSLQKIRRRYIPKGIESDSDDLEDIKKFYSHLIEAQIPLSLDQEYEGKDGETSTLADFIPDEGTGEARESNSNLRRADGKKILREANLSSEEELLFQLREVGVGGDRKKKKKYSEIVSDLKQYHGMVIAVDNARQIYSRAQRKIKQARQRLKDQDKLETL